VSLAVGNLQGSGHLTMLIPFRPHSFVYSGIRGRERGRQSRPDSARPTAAS
jgi:hypothetical protein